MKNISYRSKSPFRPLLLSVCLAGASLTTSSPAAEDSGAANHCWRFESMRPADLAQALRERPVAWLVLSPLEWHGEAIAFCADPLVGQTIAQRAWEKAGGVLIPTLYIGQETEYKVWEKEGLVDYWGLEVITKEHNPGSIYVRALTLELVLRDYLFALQREGFKLCVVMTGHLGVEHLRVLEDVCSRHQGPMKALLWKTTFEGPDLPENLRFTGKNGNLKLVGHADVDEASLVGGIDPKLVDKDKFGRSERDRKTGLRAENADEMDFEKGRAIVNFNAEQLAKKVNELLPPPK